MELNYLAILVCGIAAMVIGYVWYGPLFGKAWMKIMGVDMSTISPEERKKMQKGMAGAYILQFILSLITAGVLAVHIASWSDSTSSVAIATCTWFGFVMTTTASSALWSGKPKNVAWKMFFILAGAQLVTFVVFGFILGAWQ
jgi:hypothetical protein